MRAVVIAEHGASPELTEMRTPEPGAGEVLVRVEASSVNGFDAAVAAGYLAGMMEHRYPVVLGKDFAATPDRLAADAAAGRITIPVHRTYSLSEVPAAFDDFAAGTLGKLAIILA
jgi:NADPH:quinone reductase-like Zn-dependent oxidoreductase